MKFQTEAEEAWEYDSYYSLQELRVTYRVKEKLLRKYIIFKYESQIRRKSTQTPGDKGRKFSSLLILVFTA